MKKRQQDLDSQVTPGLEKAVAVQPVFRDHIRTLCALVKRADAVVGCVAWFTSVPLLREIGSRPCGCSVVVHDDARSTERQDVRRQYESANRLVYPVLGRHPHAFEAVGSTDYGNEARAMMHHKFLVFMQAGTADDRRVLTPYGVWCGSANMTANAERSRESAVVILGETIAAKFVEEWASCVDASHPIEGRVSRSFAAALQPDAETQPGKARTMLANHAKA